MQHRARAQGFASPLCTRMSLVLLPPHKRDACATESVLPFRNFRRDIWFNGWITAPWGDWTDATARLVDLARWPHLNHERPCRIAPVRPRGGAGPVQARLQHRFVPWL